MEKAVKSRQMAFQITEFEYRESMKQLVSVQEQVASVIDWVDKIPDEKKRRRMVAVLSVAVECHRKGMDPLSVKKIVCWRDDKGAPSIVEIEHHRPLTRS